ncbi:3-methyladenine DNA glycosylase [Nitrosophilus alvini]|uniref:3-methyladenine DNA glycosylase n=1 Tax=Nitrosophilus alvini TaxID=2714855 RepID=UPI00190DBC9B|nr:3-methyladenine DNA glycosylase [Nitrosophilus alvini]
MLDNSFELLAKLKKLGFIKEERDPYWWPGSGTFEVVVGAVLTQNTKWEKVEVALKNLKNLDLLSLEKLAEADQKLLAEAVRPAGFYNTKSFRLKKLAINMLKDFGSFEAFRAKPSRRWLLEQKGIGKETADSILCYACYKNFMVVDSYTSRLLRAFGYEFEEYDEIQEWLIEGIYANLDKIYELYGKEMPLHMIYARFHGKIVEFCKENCKGKNKNEKIKRLLS